MINRMGAWLLVLTATYFAVAATVGTGLVDDSYILAVTGRRSPS